MSMLRVFLIGDKGVGKTSLISKFVYDNPNLRAQYGSNFQYHEKKICVDGRMWKFEIASANHPGATNRYDQVGCCVLVYDVYNRTSFENLTEHIDGFVAMAHPKAYKFKYVVLGNKIDINMGCNRAVSKEEALQWCSYNRDALYFETSAKEGNNVDAAFTQIARCAIGYIPHLRGGQIYNLQDIILNNDLTGLFYLSREQRLEASEVYSIKNHIDFLYQYKSKLPHPPTPGLFLTSTNINDVPGTVWMDSEYGALQTEPDDDRSPVNMSFAWCSMMDGKTMFRNIYHLELQDLCLVHYMYA